MTMETQPHDLRPLAGVRAFELGTAIVGPICARYLCHFGAEVIKAESRESPDTMRTGGAGWISPEKYGRELVMDTGPGVNDFNAGKKSVGLNVKKPEGLAIAKRILQQCDIFVSNLTGRAIKSLGLDYASVRAVKSDIIYIQMTGYGVTPGPYTNYVAWGKNLVALTGIDELTGYPDRPPTGITRIAYPDQSNGLSGLVAVLAALDYRDRTGEGQAIDLSQFEATVALLGPEILDYATSGHSAERKGNRLPWAAPQGVYPCRGEERWVAISVFTDEEWRALCLVAERPEWADDPRFLTVKKRLDHHDELDALIAEWTQQYSNIEIAEWLQDASVAAAAVLDHPGLVLDPHLAAREFWQLADSMRFGQDFFTGVPARLSETPGYAEKAGPALGQDNDYVLRELAGCSADEVEALIEKGVVYPLASPELKLKRPHAAWLRHFTPQLRWRDSGISGI